MYAFREYDTDDNGDFHRQISPRFLKPSTWEEDIKKLTGWSDFRLEIRYQYRGAKYRLLLRPGDRCPPTFPPYEDNQTHTRKCRLPGGLFAAHLLNHNEGGDVDVTARVLKYQGPNGDFHADLGLRVYMHDMFPFDNHEDYATLCLTDTLGNRTMDRYAENPQMKAMRHFSFHARPRHADAKTE